MDDTEQGLLAERLQKREQAYRTALLSGLWTATVAITGIVGFVVLLRRHLTSRDAAAFAMAEQSERLRTTLASIGDAVITADTEGRITSVNAVAESLTGWQADEAMGQPLDSVFRVVNETTRQPVENPAARAVKQGIIVGLANHTVLLAKDGRERPIDDSAAPIRCRDGEVVGCVLVFRDVTERRAVQAANERVVATLNNLTDGFWQLDRDWRLVYVNVAAGRTVGQAPAELIGKAIWEAFPAIVGTKVEAEYRRAAAERVGVELESFYEPLGRWFGIKVSPTPDGGLAILTHDITESKRLSDELRDADRRKDEFLATLAHELRNPLAPIRNAVYVLRKLGPQTGELPQVRDMIERQVTHMVRLVDDLLEVSRITQGKIELHKEQVNLSSVVQNAVETSGPLIEAGRHELTVALPAEPVVVEGDAVRLTQVTTNLLNNAAKFTPDGGHIWLAVERDGSQGVVGRVRGAEAPAPSSRWTRNKGAEYGRPVGTGWKCEEPASGSIVAGLLLPRA